MSLSTRSNTIERSSESGPHLAVHFLPDDGVVLNGRVQPSEVVPVRLAQHAIIVHGGVRIVSGILTPLSHLIVLGIVRCSRISSGVLRSLLAVGVGLGLIGVRVRPIDPRRSRWGRPMIGRKTRRWGAITTCHE